MRPIDARLALPKRKQKRLQCLGDKDCHDAVETGVVFFFSLFKISHDLKGVVCVEKNENTRKYSCACACA